MVRTTTLDIIDADLQKNYKKYLGMDYDIRLKLFTHDIRIDPCHSERKYKKIKTYMRMLKWKEFKYSDACRNNLPSDLKSKQIGIYFLTVKPEHTILDLPCFVLYVGISGEGGSGRSLGERLSDYLRLSSVKKRENIHKVLQLYYEEAYVNYSFFAGTSKQLETLENLLHEYFNPKFALRDFDPATKKARKAWGAI